MLCYCCSVFFVLCSVSDKSLTEEVGHKELVNVEGVICDRLHTDLKYDSEKVSYASGYGIPGKLCEGEVHIKYIPVCRDLFGLLSAAVRLWSTLEKCTICLFVACKL
jgi:hypothetical protein